MSEQAKQTDLSLPMRLGREHFTYLGLLTDEEIDDKPNVSRMLVADIGKEPQFASAEEHFTDTENYRGLRTFYNIAAAEGRASKATEKIQTIEAGIYTTVLTKEPETHFTLSIRERTRNEKGQIVTTRSIALDAVQDPENPDSFIVEGVRESQGGMYEKKWPGITKKKSVTEHIHALRQDVLKIQMAAGKKALGVMNNPEVRTSEVKLPREESKPQEQAPSPPQ